MKNILILLMLSCSLINAQEGVVKIDSALVLAGLNEKEQNVTRVNVERLGLMNDSICFKLIATKKQRKVQFDSRGTTYCFINGKVSVSNIEGAFSYTYEKISNLNSKLAQEKSAEINIEYQIDADVIMVWQVHSVRGDMITIHAREVKKGKVKKRPSSIFVVTIQ